MKPTPAKQRFQSVGALIEDSVYVERAVDTELWDALLRGEFCHILAPRQIGKSSLRARLVRRLRSAGIRCASVDLTSLGTSQSSADEWYFDVVDWLRRDLGLPDPVDFFNRHSSLGPASRFSRYLRDELLVALPNQRIIIFFDEIDTIRALQGCVDDFFAVLRTVLNDRATEPPCQNLSFCLFGVVAPDDLVRTPGLLTPFNVGRAIHVDDFSRAEAETFAPGLSGFGDTASALLDQIYAWTDGHPYMMQRLCEALVQTGPSQSPPELRVRSLVDELFLRQGTQEPNLASAQQRFDEVTSQAPTLQKVSLYRRIHYGEVVAMDGQHRVQQELRLAGMVKFDRRVSPPRLVVRNRIYAQVFGDTWIREQATGGLLTDAVTRWLASGRQPSYLLRGASLEEALAWSHERTADEAQFLQASQVAQRRDERRRYLARLSYVLLVSSAGLILLLGFLIRSRLRAERAEADTQNAVAQGKQAQLERAQARHQVELEKIRRMTNEQQLLLAEKNRTKAELDAALSKQKAALAELKKAQAEAESARQHEEVIKERAASELARNRTQFAQAKLRLEVDAKLREQSMRAVEASQIKGSEYIALGRAIRTMGRDMARSASGRDWSLPESVQGLSAALGSLPAVSYARCLGHAGPIRQAHFTQDEQQVLTFAQDGLVLSFPTLRLPSKRRDWRLFPRYNIDWEPFLAQEFSQKPQTLLSNAIVPSLDEARSVAFSRERSMLAAGDAQGRVRLFEMSSHKSTAELTFARDPISTLAFSADGTQLLVASQVGGAWLWSISSNPAQNPRRLLGYGDRVQHAWFAPRGSAIATLSHEGRVQLFTTPDSSRPVLEQPQTALAFSPDGTLLLLGDARGALTLWSIPDGKRVDFREVHRDAIVAVAFSPARSECLSASRDGTVHVLRFGADSPSHSVRFLQPDVVLRGHRGGVNSAVFSPDGKTIATASDDSTARLWLTSGQLLANFTGHTGSVHTVEFSPLDGRLLLTGGRDGMALIFRTLVPDMLEAACQWFVQKPSDVKMDPSQNLLSEATEICARLYPSVRPSAS